MNVLDTIIISALFPGVQPEFRFCDRRWRFDYAWPDRKIALELEGGTWVGGRHTRGAGYRNDCRKYNRAAVLGWIVIRATTDMAADGSALQDLEAAFKARTP